jgi:hypothetical protein
MPNTQSLSSHLGIRLAHTNKLYPLYDVLLWPTYGRTLTSTNATNSTKNKRLGLMTFYTFDRRNWQKGMLIINILHAPKNDLEYDMYLNEMSSIYTDRKPFSMLVDTSKLDANLPISFIRKLADWIKKHKPESELYLTKTAILVNSNFIRLFITAVFTIIKPSRPCITTCSIQEAIEYLGWRR